MQPAKRDPRRASAVGLRAERAQHDLLCPNVSRQPTPPAFTMATLREAMPPAADRHMLRAPP